jgi:hypothetical protein
VVVVVLEEPPDVVVVLEEPPGIVVVVVLEEPPGVVEVSPPNSVVDAPATPPVSSIFVEVASTASEPQPVMKRTNSAAKFDFILSPFPEW